MAEQEQEAARAMPRAIETWRRAEELLDSALCTLAEGPDVMGPAGACRAGAKDVAAALELMRAQAACTVEAVELSPEVDRALHDLVRVLGHGAGRLNAGRDPGVELHVELLRVVDVLRAWPAARAFLDRVEVLAPVFAEAERAAAAEVADG